MIRRFCKKPVQIEAIEYDGSPAANREIIDWTRGSETPAFMDDMDHTTLKIRTLEGDHTVTVGDFVIRGVQGEFYPCKPDIFAKSYEEVK